MAIEQNKINYKNVSEIKNIPNFITALELYHDQLLLEELEYREDNLFMEGFGK